MRLLVRVDASARIGAGHVMRCLALAQAWQETGGQVTFLTGGEAPALTSRLQREGMAVTPLACQSGSAADAVQTVTLARQLGAAWAVVDGYHFRADYQRSIKDAGLGLLFIDDEGQGEHYYADLILNQNIHAQEGLYEAREPYTRLLLGPRYALLRREFWPWRGWRREIPPLGRKVLVTLGGADPDNATLKVIQALSPVELLGLEVMVIAGAFNPHKRQLEGAIRKVKNSIRLGENVSNMPDLMAWADLAITAGGSTCWELAFMGLPTLILLLADNQRPLGEGLHKLKAAVNLGWHHALSPLDIRQAATQLLQSRESRREMAAVGKGLVDGEGPARLLMLLQGQTLRLRRVREDDCRLLWLWANDEEVRKVSFSTAYIPWEEHVSWFSSKIRDPNCLHFIAVDQQDDPAGQVRFDVKEDSAVINISLDKHKRGLNFGGVLIDMATEEIFKNADIQKINALIHPNNIKSIKAFEKAKFKKVGLITVNGQRTLHYLRTSSAES